MIMDIVWQARLRTQCSCAFKTENVARIGVAISSIFTHAAVLLLNVNKKLVDRRITKAFIRPLAPPY